MSKKKIRFYESITDDFEKNKETELPDDYEWIREDLTSKILSFLIYGIAIVLSSIYCRLFLHMHIKGRKKFKTVKGGFFIYGNHTQPVGDVFIPALAVFPKRIYTVVSTANYSIPVIGKILPFLGALPLCNTLHGVRELNAAVTRRVENGNPIVIFPEAHVWEYYTDIRPFPESSLKFAAKTGKPAFALTVTYKKSKLHKRPRMEVFADGPFYPNGNTQKEKAASLHRAVYGAMKERSKNSDINFIEYRKK